jgi:large subunit ribosomal protein L29
MRIDEIRDLDSQTLQEELEGSYKELFNLRFQKATRQLADSTAIPKAKKKLARIQTVLRERELIEQMEQVG